MLPPEYDDWLPEDEDTEGSYSDNYDWQDYEFASFPEVERE